MNFETRIALALMLILVILSLSGCGRVPVYDKIIDQHQVQETQKENAEQGSIPHFQGIADALGCVFAPQSCKK